MTDWREVILGTMRRLDADELDMKVITAWMDRNDPEQMENSEDTFCLKEKD